MDVVPSVGGMRNGNCKIRMSRMLEKKNNNYLKDVIFY